jgi:FkbM family methyltransferase
MKFKKLRKIYRILFPLQLTERQIFKNKFLSNPLISNIEEDNDTYIITFSKNYKVVVRNHNHSDYEVFEQIFNFGEYDIVASILQTNSIFSTSENVLIDAGANVGFTSVYFSNLNLFKQIFCVEPSQSNVDILKRNINFLPNTDHIKVYKNALSEKENKTFELENSFRDGKDWSTATTENVNGTIAGITINEIIQENNIKRIAVLKIDIEGAERFLFKKENNLEFLKITQIIALEIHDEYQVRDLIYSILRENNFFLLESGELTIGINKTFI